jgi:hypothetical protein
MSMNRLLLATILMGAVWVTAEAATLTVDSHARARQVLDRAVNALGGAESLRAIDAMRQELEGEFLPRLQMPTPRRRSRPATSRNRCYSI